MMAFISFNKVARSFCRAVLVFLSINNAYAHDIDHSAPWDACEDLEKSAQCAYVVDEKDLYRGTCQIFQEHLMCIRNQPIVSVEGEHNDADHYHRDDQAHK